MSQIARAWDLAKSQLQELRAQVEKNAELGQLQLRVVALKTDRDKALRDLGEAVWKQVKAGKLQLQGVSGALRAVQEVEKRLDAQRAEIGEILKEGEEAAERLRSGKKPPVKTTVAPRGKSR